MENLNEVHCSTRGQGFSTVEDKLSKRKMFRRHANISVFTRRERNKREKSNSSGGAWTQIWGSHNKI